MLAMRWLKTLLAGALLVAGVSLLLYAMERRDNHGGAVTTTYPTGEIVSSLSGRGTRFIVKLNDTAETIMVHDSMLMPLPPGTKVPLERVEFADGAAKYRIVRN
jgi:hypothetical protein